MVDLDIGLAVFIRKEVHDAQICTPDVLYCQITSDAKWTSARGPNSGREFSQSGRLPISKGNQRKPRLVYKVSSKGLDQLENGKFRLTNEIDYPSLILVRRD